MVFTDRDFAELKLSKAKLNVIKFNFKNIDCSSVYSSARKIALSLQVRESSSFISKSLILTTPT